jgi:hypothetical protein
MCRLAIAGDPVAGGLTAAIALMAQERGDVGGQDGPHATGLRAALQLG